MRQLAQRFFGCRIFFDQAFRGNYIKRSIHFYIGLVQDLHLNVAPFPRHGLNAIRLLDEIPFRPPNVRSWVGGRMLINPGTLNSRRQLVATLFNEFNLNADEQVQLVAARATSRAILPLPTNNSARYLPARRPPKSPICSSTFF